MKECNVKDGSDTAQKYLALIRLQFYTQSYLKFPIIYYIRRLKELFLCRENWTQVKVIFITSSNYKAEHRTMTIETYYRYNKESEQQ